MGIDILIIGNGFDLAHDLETRYKDFLDFCFYSKDTKYVSFREVNFWFKHFYTRKDYLGDTWIDLEEEIFLVIKSIKSYYRTEDMKIILTDFPLEYHFIKDNSNMDLANLNGYMRKPANPFAVDKCGYAIYPDIKSSCANAYIASYNGFINFLYEQLREFTKMFEQYLQKEVIDGIDKSKKYRLVLDSRRINDGLKDWVVSFNYTNTIEILYNGEKLRHPPVYIHGAINKERSCNLVLGTKSFENLTSDGKLDIPYEFNIFKKYTQRHQYRTVIEFQNLLRELDKQKSATEKAGNDLSDFLAYHIIGHSLNETDHDILRHLLNAVEKAPIYIYYYDNEEAHKKLIDNITHILDESSATRRVLFIKQHDEKNGILRKNIPEYARFS